MKTKIVNKMSFANGSVFTFYIYNIYNIMKFMDWIYGKDLKIYLERKYNKYIEFRKWNHDRILNLGKQSLSSKKRYLDYLESSEFDF